MMMDAELVVQGRTRRRSKIIKPRDLHRPDIPGDSRGAFNRDLDWKAFVWRFFACLFAAIALLAPMLVMVLHKGLHTALITVCVSVFLAALVIAKFLEESFGAVVGYVAGYTAVLVVFVGTTS
jgi:VIT1/CCC1 family predicted Fe2+/Mn2+ transporter